MTTPIKIICLLVVTVSYAAVVPVDNKASTPASAETAKSAPVEVIANSTTPVSTLSESTPSAVPETTQSAANSSESTTPETTMLDVSKTTVQPVTAGSSTIKADVKQNKETKALTKDASRESPETKELPTTEDKLEPHLEFHPSKFNPWYDGKFDDDDTEDFNYPDFHGFDGEFKVEYVE